MKTLLLAASAVVALTATAANADTRGPDTAGYVATDNVTYTFNDITATGTKVLEGVDDQEALVNMGMSFNFYGTTYTAAYLSSNGLINFGFNNGQFTNADLTTTQFGGGPGIFTWWDDLVTYTDGDPSRGVYYQTIGDTPGSRKFVVQEVAKHFSFQNGTQSINFQTVLDEATGDILMRYTQTAFGSPNFDNGASATVGIQGLQSLGQYVQWSFNQPVLRDNESLCFTQNPNAACNAIVDNPGGVPEPATWGLMLLGFGGMGAMLRRRQTSARIRFA